MSLEEFIKLKHSKKKHKYNAKPCTSKEGIRFPSTLEKTYFDRLIEAKQKNQISFFLRQVPFQLPGNTKYIVDFLLYYPDDEIVFVDVKGKMTPMSILKIKQVEALYPIKIKIVDKNYLTNNFI